MKPLGRLVLIIGVAQACRPGWAGQIQFPLSSDKQTYLEEPGQELTAAFLPQKPVYLLGEPIWFIFEVKNLGTSLSTLSTRRDPTAMAP